MTLTASLLFYVIAIVCFGIVVVFGAVGGLTATERIGLGLVAFVLGHIVP